MSTVNRDAEDPTFRRKPETSPRSSSKKPQGRTASARRRLWLNVEDLLGDFSEQTGSQFG